MRRDTRGRWRAAFVLSLLLLALAGCSGASSRGRLNISLTTAPGPPETGPTTYVVALSDEAGRPVDDATVTFSSALREDDREGPSGTMTFEGAGRYTMVVALGSLGEWKVTIKATGEGYEPAQKDFDIMPLSIPPQP